MATKKPRNGNGKSGEKLTVAGAQKLSTEELALYIKSALIKEALEDPAFRKLALKDPASAIQKSRLTGGVEKALPAGFTFRVVEETQQLLYLVIPHKMPERLDPKNPKHILLKKAVSDPQYLQKLTADPRSVLQSEFLVDVPPGFQIRVIKETPLESVAVLPADLRPEQTTAIPKELIEYQASGWCGKTLKTIIENLCPKPPGETEFESPFCTPDCGVQPL